MLGIDLSELGLPEAADRILTGLEDLAKAIRETNSVQEPTTKRQLIFQMALACPELDTDDLQDRANAVWAMMEQA